MCVLLADGDIDMRAVRSIVEHTLVAAAIAVTGMTAFAQGSASGAKGDTGTNADPMAIATPTPVSDAALTGDPAVDSPEAKEVYNYYNNYLKEYRLGPNDVITVEVFGQCPDYCKSGVTVPPTARISYPLIREGVLVAGKTVEQVAAEITKKLDEYIIDPKVSVTLDKAMSIRYSVMGKVGAPGVRIMDRKISVYEAVIDAGGVAKGGDKKKTVIVSYTPQGKLSRRVVSLADMESGKAEMIFLNPGDQVFVPGKGFSFEKVFEYIGRASAVRMLFGSPF